jgi:hypothetical protein
MGLRDRLLNRAKREFNRVVNSTSTAPPVDARSGGDEIVSLWEELSAEFLAGFQAIGASTVSSWEVALAELHRAGKRAYGQEVATKMVERFSDALVPTVGVFNAANLAARGIWKESVEFAKEAGHLEQAVEHVCVMISPIAGQFQDEWPKTVEYLAPVLEQISASEATLEALLAIGPKVSTQMAVVGETYMDDLRRLVGSPDLHNGFLDAVEAYKQGSGRIIEIELDAVRALLVASVEATE